jgi:hypothetical protein
MSNEPSKLVPYSSLHIQPIHPSVHPQGLFFLPTQDAWRGLTSGLSSAAALEDIDLADATLAATITSGGLPLYWLAQGSTFDLATLPGDGEPVKIPTEVRGCECGDA